MIKPLAVLAAAAAGVGAGVAVAATGSTELGGTTTAPVYGAYAPVVQFATTPGTKPYTTPAGVLTKWRYHSSGGAPAGSVRLALFKPTGPPGAYEAVANSEPKTLAPNTGYEFSERIPVKDGYVLGLDPDLDAEVAITIPAATGDLMYQFGSDVPVGATSTATGPFPAYRVNVSATVEPDADGDGYGDESQDQCATDASTQGPCPDVAPPETTITKGPAKKSAKPKAKFKFSASEPGSTFACQLKGPGLDQAVKQFGACTSPRKYRRLLAGKYKFSVHATDAAGNTDPIAATAKFKVQG